MRAQTIQQTAKRWKLMTALGFLGVAASVAMAFSGDRAMVHAAGTIFFLSIPPLLLGQLGAWWFHS